MESDDIESDDIIHRLQLQAHPEGGHYREFYRSSQVLPKGALPAGFCGDRVVSTAIYYLLRAGEHSVFHRIKSDEIWVLIAGGVLEIHELTTLGEYRQTDLGSGSKSKSAPCYVVPAGSWFAARPAPSATYSLVSCIVAPGFDFADFEIANRVTLCQQFPEYSKLIEELTNH